MGNLYVHLGQLKDSKSDDRGYGYIPYRGDAGDEVHGRPCAQPPPAATSSLCSTLSSLSNCLVQQSLIGLFESCCLCGLLRELAIMEMVTHFLVLNIGCGRMKGILVA